MNVYNRLDGRPVLDSLNVLGNIRSDQKEAEFVNRVLAILGDARFLYLPRPDDIAISQPDETRHGTSISWIKNEVATALANFDKPPTRLGSGFQLSINGSDEYANINTTGGLGDEFDFVFGGSDHPLSMGILMRPTSLSGTVNYLIGGTFLSGGVTFGNIEFFLDASAQPTIQLRDETNVGVIGRRDATALSVDTYTLLVGAYNGTQAIPGLALYKDAIRVDDTNVTSATIPPLSSVLAPSSLTPAFMLCFCRGMMVLTLLLPPTASLTLPRLPEKVLIFTLPVNGPAPLFSTCPLKATFMKDTCRPDWSNINESAIESPLM